jgi:hypothetical protein
VTEPKKPEPLDARAMSREGFAEAVRALGREEIRRSAKAANDRALAEIARRYPEKKAA